MEVKCSPYLGKLVKTIKKRAMYYKCIFIFVVQSLSRVWLFATPWTVACHLPCPSLSAGVYSNSCSLSQWCPSIWMMPSRGQSRPLLPLCPPVLNLSQHHCFSSESALPIRWPKDWGFTSASVLPMNIQDWFSLGWTGLISLQSKGLSRVLFSTMVRKHQSCVCIQIYIDKLQMCVHIHM